MSELLVISKVQMRKEALLWCNMRIFELSFNSHNARDLKMKESDEEARRYYEGIHDRIKFCKSTPFAHLLDNTLTSFAKAWRHLPKDIREKYSKIKRSKK